MKALYCAHTSTVSQTLWVFLSALGGTLMSVWANTNTACDLFNYKNPSPHENVNFCPLNVCRIFILRYLYVVISLPLHGLNREIRRPSFIKQIVKNYSYDYNQ